MKRFGQFGSQENQRIIQSFLLGFIFLFLGARNILSDGVEAVQFIPLTNNLGNDKAPVLFGQKCLAYAIKWFSWSEMPIPLH